MSWRRFKILLKHLPADSATARAVGHSGWTTADYLISDVWHALTGEQHPARPQAVTSRSVMTSQRKSHRAAALRRAAARRQAIASGEIT
ncbi:hypothetical protein [Microtetraspora malaysiensis]|uniref:hypothetical protein n=1 Tax=Microtetraspora malaysiensis TaxID=161358 RepID=UPI003D910A79